MKSIIAMSAAAFLAVAFTSAVGIRAAGAQTSETPPQSSEQAEPKKPDDKAKEHGGHHEGGCCKMMQDMHGMMEDMHGKMEGMHGMMHDMQGHGSKDGGGEHGCCGMMNGH